ncbi:MAG: hypothetical protein K2G38_03275 [Clostridia bacterium]|nr:hypothetical protein [Clostridia bacterium]
MRLKKILVTVFSLLILGCIFAFTACDNKQLTDLEKFERYISKIYGKRVETEEVAVAQYNSNATIDEAYRIKDDGNYLIKSTGKGGYDNGTVTCWVVINVSGGAIKGIDKVIIESSRAQTYIDRVGDDALSQFGELYEDGIIYTPYLITNATVKGTKNAICNAVNGALDFVNAVLGIVVDCYEDYDFVEYIATRKTTHEINDDGSITFNIVTKDFKETFEFKINISVNSNGVITDYAITENGSTNNHYFNYMHEGILDGTLFVGKDFAGIEAILNNGISLPSDNSGTEISTGATHSNYLCLYAVAFATKNYDKLVH